MPPQAKQQLASIGLLAGIALGFGAPSDVKAQTWYYIGNAFDRPNGSSETFMGGRV